MPRPLPPDRRRFIASSIALLPMIACAVLPLPARAQQLYDDFLFAIANDRVDQVRSLLARGIDPNTVTPNGEPVLLIAARAGYTATLEALLSARAINVNARSSVGDTALMVAALGGRLTIVKKLRARGAEVNGRGWTPLMYAATGGHDDIVRYLLAEGADINALSPNGTTALMMATRENRLSTLELLLAKGADANQRNQSGASALDWAKRNEDPAMVERLKRAR